jgi:hypothetical protein
MGNGYWLETMGAKPNESTEKRDAYKMIFGDILKSNPVTFYNMAGFLLSVIQLIHLDSANPCIGGFPHSAGSWPS